MNNAYVIEINMPRIEMATPAIAVLLCSVFKLENPRTIPRRLAMPPQMGISAAQRLINPNAGEAMAKNRAVRN